MSKIQTSKLRAQLTSEVDSFMERLYTSNDIFINETLKEFGVSDLMELSEALDTAVNSFCAEFKNLNEESQMEMLASKAKSKAVAAAKYVKSKAKEVVDFSKSNPAAAAVIGTAVLAAMGATALYIYLNTNAKKWDRAVKALAKAKATDNTEKVKEITNQMRAIKANMSKADAELRKKFNAMTPEQKKAFVAKKGELLAKMKQREKLK